MSGLEGPHGRLLCIFRGAQQHSWEFSHHLLGDIYMWFQMCPDVPWVQVTLAESGWLTGLPREGDSPGRTGKRKELRMLTLERTGLYFYLLHYSVVCISV